MPRGRGGGKGAKSRPSGKAPVTQDVPDVYREMLADVVSSSPTRKSEEGRVVKRRRVGGQIVLQESDDAMSCQSDQRPTDAPGSDMDDLFEDIVPNQQRIIQTESEDSADSDIDWEEVDLRDHEKEEVTPEPEISDTGDLNLVLGGDEQRTSKYGRVKRKPMTAADKRFRLEVHKIHVSSLLVHVHLRNHWCNDEKIYTTMRKLLTKKTISYLNPDENNSQFQQSRSFMDGLTQASDTFKSHFKITARGMSKSRWAESPETLALLQPPDDIDLPMQLSDFRDAANQLQASRDVGGQLFCAMLRSAGVDARLVCSLQPLPFQPSQRVEMHQVAPRPSKAVEHKSREIAPNKSTGDQAASDGSAFAGNIGSSGGSTRFDPQPHSQLELTERSSSPEGLSSKVPLRPKKRRKPIRESKYPIYWVEAFNEAVQKWVPVDPIVTKTLAKPSKFEPPAGEPENKMTYVIAFEDDGSARDVTKRYVKAYNAKTRRERVEATSGGERWWRRVMKMYRRPHHLDRDQVEDAELIAKEAAEPMPRNVQDFKDHPYYALERHLKRHEVIHPKREVGKIGSGRASSMNNLEAIFRRRDVHMVKSADKWYRLGREIKPGEQPLKRVPTRRTREQSADPNDLDTRDNAGTALYAAHQTSLYFAPPVKNGRVPKNVYGNLDIYVSSMLPPGGAHIPHPETARAARIVGVDYSDAVTGFVFKGRHGTAVIKGAVVASEYREAVEEVIKAFEDDRARAEEGRRSAEALRMWKRLLAGLRIRERIEGYDIEGERDFTANEEMNDVDDDEQYEEAGGFLPDRDAADAVEPTAGRMSYSGPPDLVANGGGGFMAESSGESSATQHEVDPPRARDPFINNLDDDDGGGFLVNDEHADHEEALQEAIDKEHDPSRLKFITRTEIETEPNSVDDQEAFDEGDGFMPEENSELACTTYVNESTKGPEIDRNQDSLNKPSSVEALTNIRIEELEEARMLQQLYETGGMAQSPTIENEATATAHVDSSPELASEDLQMEMTTAIGSSYPRPDPESASPEGERRMEDAADSENSDDDKGSLISHDPEDEDADPE